MKKFIVFLRKVYFIGTDKSGFDRPGTRRIYCMESNWYCHAAQYSSTIYLFISIYLSYLYPPTALRCIHLFFFAAIISHASQPGGPVPSSLPIIYSPWPGRKETDYIKSKAS